MIDHMGKYYEWADKRIIGLLEGLDEDSFVKPLEGTGKSLRDLAEHIMVYYEYFVYRDAEIPLKNLQEKLQAMSKQELLDHWKKVMTEFSEAVQNFEEDLLDLPLSKSESVKVSKQEYLFCYTDHATYHRGQLISTFKAVTNQDAVSTDYYDFFVDHQKKT